MARRWLRQVALVAVCLAVFGCQADYRTDVRSLAADFPAVQRLHLVTFMSTPECDLMIYSRGAFTSAPGSEPCQLDVTDSAPRVVFDAQAKADLRALRSATESNGRQLQHADVSFQSDGTVGPDSWFGFELLVGYVYRPSAQTIAGFVDSTCAERIDADWYRTWPC